MKNRDTDADWKLVAESDPYWGVISSDRFKGANVEGKTLEEFMAGGEAFVAELYGQVQRHMDRDFAPSRVLDFGCGVGRLVLPFARRAKEVVGVDIAPAMLERCRTHASDHGLTNIRLVQSDDDLLEVDDGFDLVNSYIVLQHIPVQRGMRYIRLLASKLKPGGVGSLHVTYAKSGRMMIHEVHKTEFYRRDGDTLASLVATEWVPPAGTITMFDYDLNQVMAEVMRFTTHPMAMVPTNHGGHLGVQIIFRRTR